MGWSSWNAFHGSINEAVITNVTEALIATGLRDVGFVYVNLDE
jgi:alpha-galactosidase|eukprot:COSAG06_NODE_6512_length_2900_cov_2.361657_2_plen_43_part_00